MSKPYSFQAKTREATRPSSASLEDSTSKPGPPLHRMQSLQLLQTSTTSKHSLTGHMSFPRDEQVERSRGEMLVPSSRQMLVPGSRQMQERLEPEVQRHVAILLTPV